MSQPKFDYDITSDSNYDELLVDVLYDDELIFNISQDEGPEKPKICFYFPRNKMFWDVPIFSMFKVIHEARIDLNENLKEHQLEMKFERSNVISYKLFYNPNVKKEIAVLFFKESKMGKIYQNEANQWHLKILTNPQTVQDFYVPQWEVYLVELKLIIDAAKQALEKIKNKKHT